MANRRRVFRVAERIQTVIARELIRLSDPRLYLVTISSVVTSSDLRNAKVYWMATDGKNRIEEVTEGFEAASGVLRSAVGKELGIRHTPELRFFYDDTLDVQEEMNSLFQRINKGSPSASSEDEEEEQEEEYEDEEERNEQ